MNGRSVPGAARCLLLLALFDVVLRVAGMRRSIALARWLGRGRPSGVTVEAGKVAARVAAAACFYPRRALCLEQSLALFVLLRRRGLAAELRFGVRPYPFHAHAWVDVDGLPVHEQPDAIGQLTRFTAAGG
jgi:hypothetical protein